MDRFDHHAYTQRYYNSHDDEKEVYEREYDKFDDEDPKWPRLSTQELMNLVVNMQKETHAALLLHAQSPSQEETSK